MMFVKKNGDQVQVLLDSGVKLNLSFEDGEKRLCETLRVMSRQHEAIILNTWTDGDLVDIMKANGFYDNKDLVVLSPS